MTGRGLLWLTLGCWGLLAWILWMPKTGAAGEGAASAYVMLLFIAPFVVLSGGLAPRRP